MTLQWHIGEDCYTGLTANRVYQIVRQVDPSNKCALRNYMRWQLRVRDRETPEGVPLEDLWLTLAHYMNVNIAMEHAYIHEETAA